MPGWVPFDADDWPDVAANMPRPWPTGAASFHLRWLLDQGRPIPGRPSLRSLFGWTDWRVRQLLRSESFLNPIGNARRQRAASAPPADRQRAASPPPATERANLDNGDDSASRPPALRQPAASAPPAGRHTRIDPDSYSDSDSDSDKDMSANASGESFSELVERLTADSEPKNKRQAQVVRYLQAQEAWHAYQRDTLNQRPRKSAHTGSAGTVGGSLWAIAKQSDGSANLCKVLAWLAKSSHDRAKYYREQRLGLVTIRRHLAELEELAYQDDHDPGLQENVNTRYGSTIERSAEGAQEAARKILTQSGLPDAWQEDTPW
jgi:hypothetical protein